MLPTRPKTRQSPATPVQEFTKPGPMNIVNAR